MKTFWFSALVITMTMTANPPADAAESAPVDFTYQGFDDDHDPQGTKFKVKVNSSKPISQVDIQFTYFDKGGKKLGEETYAWQNVVKGKKNPIEAGKTYETDRGPYHDGAAKAEAKLLRVIFADGSRWNAK